MLTLSDKGNRCYLPAINFCAGDKGVVDAKYRKVLENVTITELNAAISCKLLFLARHAFNNAYFELLSLLAGMFMLGGRVNGHMHWAALDCYKGVLYMGNGIIRLLEPGDLASREAAKKFFTDGGFMHISEVRCLVALPVSKKRRRND